MGKEAKGGKLPVPEKPCIINNPKTGVEITECLCHSSHCLLCEYHPDREDVERARPTGHFAPPPGTR